MDLTLEPQGGGWRVGFTAMAGPCELLVDAEDAGSARSLGETAAAEARRIEEKFSRYRTGNAVHAVNGSGGRPVTVDQETAGLLDFAARCFELSGGRFDVTSGVLRRLWTFDGSDRVPSRREVKKLAGLIGWDKVRWERPRITLPAGMEIDLGGIGKEYAVDRAASLLGGLSGAAVLINFGGDLRATGTRRDGRPWEVGIEIEGGGARAPVRIELACGALATSGDAHRFLLKDGVRYPHILNPLTGWPVMRAPRSVTVLGDSCLEAGLLSTLAMLHGRKAEAFLAEQDVKHWVVR